MGDAPLAELEAKAADAERRLEALELQLQAAAGLPKIGSDQEMRQVLEANQRLELENAKLRYQVLHLKRAVREAGDNHLGES